MKIKRVYIPAASIEIHPSGLCYRNLEGNYLGSLSPDLSSPFEAARLEDFYL